MGRSRALAYAAVATCLVAGCKDQPTGVHITVHANGIFYDELRFGVIDIVGDGTIPTTLVDPLSAGRKTGLPNAPNPDVVVLLDDSIAGHELLCGVAALVEGEATGSGHNSVQAQAHRIRDVDIFLMGAPGYDAGAPVDADHGGSGGRGGGTGGSSGAGGGDANGAGGGSGTGGAGSTGTGGSNGSGGASGNGGGSGAGGTDGSGGNTGLGGSGAGGSGAGGTNGSGGNTGIGGKAGTGMLGTPCTNGGQCASTFCADNVCCDKACTDACTTCKFNQGTAGTCRQAMNNAPDPHHVCVDTGVGNCGTDGTCDNTGACATKFNTACTPGCASATSRFTSGICLQTGCVGVTAIACPASMPSCVAGVCR